MQNQQGLGNLDRTGKIYSIANELGTEGQVRPIPTLQGQIYLRREVPSARTVIAGARDAEQIEDVIVMRWFDDLRVGWEIEVESVRYRITRRDEIGRRIGWRCYCRAIE